MDSLPQNRLLGLFLKAEKGLDELIEEVHLEQHYVVSRPNEVPSYVYFPLSCVASVIVVMREGQTAEAATIGNEGMTGISALLSGPSQPGETIIQVEGDAARIVAPRISAMVEANPALRRLVHHYVLAVISQISQSAACNRLHSVEERAARWLLMTADRVRSNEFRLTHDFLSTMLGVRRTSTTLAVAALQTAGMLRYSRNHMSIVNRQGLEEVACECYEVIRQEYERLFGYGSGSGPGLLQ
jgi:CRP-like cAMP-binding protein